MTDIPIIKFENISKRFGNNQVLRNVNLEIYQGETITIIGGSGSGKSVTLKLILRLIEPDDGSVYFKGKNILDMNEEELLKMRSQIGMLFQGAALFDSLSVYENIAYPILEHFDYPKSKIDEIVNKKLNMVGLDGVQNRLSSDLSGGMKKRVGLARAIATDPEAILYDEPTTGLDPANTRRIDDLILELQKALKVTSIVVTHDMDSAFLISDRIALLHQGHIEFVGTVDEIKNSQNEVVQNFIQGHIGEI